MQIEIKLPIETCGLSTRSQPATRISFGSPLVRRASARRRQCAARVPPAAAVRGARIVYFGGTARCVLIYSHFSPHSNPTHISKFSSGELITTTSIHTAMTLKELPQSMEFVSCEHASFSTAGNDSSRPNFGQGECYYLLSSQRGEFYKC